MTNKEIGERIRLKREELGLTMTELAKKVDVSDTTILRYERGEILKIKMPVIQSIAHALSVNPMWIIGKAESEKVLSAEQTILKDTYFNFAKEMQDKNVSEDDMKKLWAFYDMIQNR